MMSDSEIRRWKVAGLVDREMRMPYNRDGNNRKSHFLCIDGLTTPHKPLLMLSEQYIASHPTNRKELYDRPTRPQQMDAYGKLLEYGNEKPLSAYHRATIHLNSARCFLGCLDSRSDIEENLLMITEYHFKAAHYWATSVIDQRKLDITSEECVPFNDIITAANDVKDSLYARKLYMDTLDEDNMVGVIPSLSKPMLPLEIVEHNASEYNQSSDAPDSRSSEDVGDIGAQDGLDGSDTSTVQGPDGTINTLNSDFEEVAYEDTITKAKQNPTMRVELAPIDVDQLYNMTDVRMIHGFMYFLVHDKHGLSNLMNSYLDRMDAALELGEPDITMIRNALTVLNVGDDGNGLAVLPDSSPNTPSAPFSPIASALPTGTNLINTERESRKKRKIAEEDEEDDIL
ncbi:hypothetical protein BOTCAL_0213g00170 [Botryotinia calthae]|uniref:Uncharacterized protein n=1 Tax=Botryotinia calthae TaxID=38488 RepID=A0A4Y8D142_9HELO|nr:hypothetical protein BOTCAL_0213g00170 [Botryotinia calthae]